MMHQFNFDGTKLTDAVRKTFAYRKTELPEGKKLFAKEIYDEKSDRQTLWKAFLNKGDIKYVPEKLSAVAKDIEKFLCKPLNAISKAEKFDVRWKASGPWR